MTPPEVLVIGVGSPDAGDDAVGPIVAGLVAGLAPPCVEVRTHEDPTDLTLLWSGRDRVVVVDAIRSGAPPGTIHTITVGDQWAAYDLPGGSHGTHDFGLASAIALGQALGTLPGQLEVVGVEGASFVPGEPLSPAVHDVLRDTVVVVLDRARPAREEAC